MLFRKCHLERSREVGFKGSFEKNKIYTHKLNEPILAVIDNEMEKHKHAKDLSSQEKEDIRCNILSHVFENISKYNTNTTVKKYGKPMFYTYMVTLYI